MKGDLAEMLHLDLEPVGVCFANTKSECDMVTEPGKRICVIPLLLSAAHGKVVGITEEGCTCPGGTVGLCFGDGFTRKNPNIHKMLSQGMGDATPEQAPPTRSHHPQYGRSLDKYSRYCLNMAKSPKTMRKIFYIV